MMIIQCHLMGLLYLPTKIRFLIGGECFGCHRSKLTSSQHVPRAEKRLPNTLCKQQQEFSTCIWCDQVMHLELCQICVPAGVKRISFSVCATCILVGRSNIMQSDWHQRKQWVLFSLDSQCSFWLRLEVFPLGPVILSAFFQLWNLRVYLTIY